MVILTEAGAAGLIIKKINNIIVLAVTRQKSDLFFEILIRFILLAFTRSHLPINLDYKYRERVYGGNMENGDKS